MILAIYLRFCCFSPNIYTFALRQFPLHWKIFLFQKTNIFQKTDSLTAFIENVKISSSIPLTNATISSLNSLISHSDVFTFASDTVFFTIGTVNVCDFTLNVFNSTASRLRFHPKRFQFHRLTFAISP